MLAFTLSSLKDATSHLFTQPSFDDFDVLSVTIVSYITFSMDGHLNAAFFEEADTQPDKLCSWQRLRPVSFQITFFLDKDKASNLFNDSMLANNQDIDGFTLHLSYRNHTLSLSTGTVFSRFSLDRDSERLWDHYVAAWIKQKQLDFEEA